MTPEEVRSFLEEPRTAVLTTIGRDEYPHSAGMWFSTAGNSVRMWTYAKSQKAVNARRNPKAAFLVEDGVAYNELRGVLAKGELIVVDEFEEIRRIGIELYDRYTRPSSGVAVEDGPIVEIERQARKRIGLVMSLADIASWDHAKL